MPLARGSFCNWRRGTWLRVRNFAARRVAETERLRERRQVCWQCREIVSESQNRALGSFWLTQVTAGARWVEEKLSPFLGFKTLSDLALAGCTVVDRNRLVW
jgi:hypothetical protein